jgi:hypothetical protein
MSMAEDRAEELDIGEREVTVRPPPSSGQGKVCCWGPLGSGENGLALGERDMSAGVVWRQYWQLVDKFA